MAGGRKFSKENVPVDKRKKPAPGLWCLILLPFSFTFTALLSSRIKIHYSVSCWQWPPSDSIFRCSSSSFDIPKKPVVLVVLMDFFTLVFKVRTSVVPVKIE